MSVFKNKLYPWPNQVEINRDKRLTFADSPERSRFSTNSHLTKTQRLGPCRSKMGKVTTHNGPWLPWLTLTKSNKCGNVASEISPVSIIDLDCAKSYQTRVLIVKNESQTVLQIYLPIMSFIATSVNATWARNSENRIKSIWRRWADRFLGRNGTLHNWSKTAFSNCEYTSSLREYTLPRETNYSSTS